MEEYGFGTSFLCKFIIQTDLFIRPVYLSYPKYLDRQAWANMSQTISRQQILIDAFYIFSSKECNLMMIWWSGILCPFQHYLCHTVTKRRLIMPRKALWSGVQSWTEPKDPSSHSLYHSIQQIYLLSFLNKTYLVDTHWNCLSEYLHGMFWCKSSRVVPWVYIQGIFWCKIHRTYSHLEICVCKRLMPPTYMLIHTK